MSKLATAPRHFGYATQSALAPRILNSSISTSSPTSSRLFTTATSRQPLNSRIRPVARPFHRQYSDAPAAPPKKPGKFRRTLKWTWRLTYLSLLGGIAYVSWDVWQSNNPEPQTNPDPTKKTLVILGRLSMPPSFASFGRGPF